MISVCKGKNDAKPMRKTGKTATFKYELTFVIFNEDLLC